MRNIAFPKISFFQKVTLLKKLRRSTWFKKVPLLHLLFFFYLVFIVNSFSTKKVRAPKSTRPKQLPILKKWLLGRSFALKKEVFWKKWLLRRGDCSYKRSSSKKVASLKKYELRKINFCVVVVTLKKSEKLASPEIKLSLKSRYICEKENHHLKKATN